MKAAIVRSSTLEKYRRWDAEFYLGNLMGAEQAEKVERARRNLDRAIAQLKNAIQEATDVAARTQRMIEDGEVIPL